MQKGSRYWDPSTHNQSFSWVLALSVTLLAQVSDLGAVVAFLIYCSSSLHEDQTKGILVAVCFMAGKT